MRVLAFVAGLTHLHNISILQKILPEMRFTAMLYEHLSRLVELPVVKEMGIEIVLHNSQDVDPALWNPRPHLLYLSTAYPEPYRCRLVREALLQDVSILAMQEGNQQANLSGKSTHYMLPVDKVGVISPFEAKGFLDLGFRQKQVVVAGWPFGSGARPCDGAAASLLKRDLGIGSNEKVALLILSLLKEKQIQCFETRRIRTEMLSFVSEGLPEDIKLVIKPHPADDRAEISKVIKLCKGSAILMDHKVPIEEALEISDVVITRGNSQVMFEVMKRGLPLAVVPLGFPTLFASELPEVVARAPAELGSVCRRVMSCVPNYSKVLAKHIPIDTADSLEHTARLFRETAAAPLKFRRWEKSLDLCLQMKLAGMDALAVEELERLKADGELPADFSRIPQMLEKLFSEDAEPDGVSELLNLIGNHKIRGWHIQALWIRQMYHQKLNRSQVNKGLPIVQTFTGSVNSHYFIRELLMKMELEFVAGSEEEGNRLRSWFRENYYFWPPFEKQEMKLRLLKDHKLDLSMMWYWISCGVGRARSVAGITVKHMWSWG